PGYPEPRFLPAGDLALSVEFGDVISPELNARVRALEHLIRARGVGGVVETVPSYRSLLVYYDPFVVAYGALIAALKELLPHAREHRHRRRPVLYLLGREPGRVLDHRADAAAPVRSGRRGSRAAPAGRPRALPHDRPRRVPSARRRGRRRDVHSGHHSRMIRVVEPGPLTTVQDLGRRGYLRYGIPESGPIDRAAFVLANRLVGNPDAAAGLECTLAGPRLEILAPGALAATGAEMPL